MSRKLILTLISVGLSVVVVTAYAAERSGGPQLSPGVQKPLPGKVSNPNIINPAARSVVQIKPVVVEIPPVSVVTGHPATLTIKVKSTDGAPVKQGDVYLRINGSLFDLGLLAAYVGVATGQISEATLAPMVTDDNGIISLPMTPAPDNSPGSIIHMGANTIEAEFTGKSKADNIKYKPAKGTGTLTILSK